MLSYRREIDGLRAVAVVPVIFFHAGFEAFSGGFVGVDVFFVISGYLMTALVLAEKAAGTFSLSNFYERRARRILPALFLVMLACIPFAWQLLPPNHLKDFAHSLMAVTLFVSNLFFWRESGYFDTEAELKPLLHTWSLGVEAQFYLLFPLFVGLAWRRARKHIAVLMAVAAVASLAAAHWGALNKPSATFFLLPTRGWEFLIGGLIALHGSSPRSPERTPWTGNVVSAAGLALIAFAVFAFDARTPFPSAYALIPTVGAGLVIMFATPETVIGKWLGSKPLVGMGLISYSAYLWHQPVFAFARFASLDEPSEPLLLGLAAASVGLACLSWKYVELPFRRTNALGRRHIATGAFAFGAAFLVLAGVASLGQGLPGRFEGSVHKALEGAHDFNPRRAECHAGPANYIAPEQACTLGDPRRVVGALLGDSHADAISFALETALGARGIGVKSMTYMSCPPLLNTSGIVSAIYRRCPEYNAAAFELLKARHDYEFVILAARWTLFLEGNRFDNTQGGVEGGLRDPANVLEPDDSVDERQRGAVARQRYQDTVRAYLDMGKKVILVYPVPEVGWNVPLYAAKTTILEGDTVGPTTRYDVYQSRSRRTIEALDALGEHRNLVRVRPDLILCNTYVMGKCATRLAGVPLYYDDNHLSNAGAGLVVAELMQHIAQ